MITEEYNEKGGPVNKEKKGRPDKCVAKVEQNNNRIGYYILTNIDNEIFDPLNRDRKRKEFRKVPKKCFELYVLYLSTRNKGYFEESLKNRLGTRHEIDEVVEPEDKSIEKNVHSVNLTKADKSYIEQWGVSKSLDDLSKDIGKPRPLISDYVEYIKRSTSKKLMGKPTEGVTILTREAAERGDEFSKKDRPKHQSLNDRTAYIHKIK